MSTEDNNNTPPEAAEAATAVSFADDFDDNNDGRKTASELRAAKERASLSKSAKAWDLDGDGELDEAERALKEMDKSHKGTLSKEQMYELMQDNLKTQRELFKVKKVVFGLVAFTCVLALSNLGTSFAAAFLAKDTKTTNDDLTDTKTGNTVGTQTARDTVAIDSEFNEESRRRRMAACTGTNNVVCTVQGDYVPSADGLNIVSKCAKGKTVQITKTFSNGATATHTVCQGTGPTYVGCPNLNNCASGASMTATVPNSGRVSIGPDPQVSTQYVIATLKSGTNGACNVSGDCVYGHVCESNVCKKKVGQSCTSGSTNECLAAGQCLGVSGGGGFISIDWYCQCDDVLQTGCDVGQYCAGPNTNMMGAKFCYCQDDTGCATGETCFTAGLVELCQGYNPEVPKMCSTHANLCGAGQCTSSGCQSPK